MTEYLFLIAIIEGLEKSAKESKRLELNNCLLNLDRSRRSWATLTHVPNRHAKTARAIYGLAWFDDKLAPWLTLKDLI